MKNWMARKKNLYQMKLRPKEKKIKDKFVKLINYECITQIRKEYKIDKDKYI